MTKTISEISKARHALADCTRQNINERKQTVQNLKGKNMLQPNEETPDIQKEKAEWIRSWERAVKEGYPIHLSEKSLEYYLNILKKL